ncbi:hypothetical protein BN946_scf184750.g7 [Trametes cinnabarina]|uniref:NYN domain-containing protein n=1 Tax=Pycnoporus cinnabarinus TaxID=5643 RepID=A0A060SPP8_PYCCI|nr:hypothetical protein BN946_scf184750.g7 [Trametes cinnabarina]
MTVEDSLHEHVAIFWDYENCTPPCNVPGYDVVNNIRQVAHEYGSVKLFKAYLELSEQSSSKSIGLRSELQSCGVSLTDCPHNGRKDVADKMMIVDMLTYAIDNPAPATILLISGDRDFVYAVSVLRLRRYRVVVVAPFTAHASLKSQATVVLDWDADIMRKTSTRTQAPETSQALVDDAQQRSPRRPTLTAGASLPQATPRSNRRASFRVPASAPMGISEGDDALPFGTSQGRHSRSISATLASALRPGVSHSPDPPARNAGLGRPFPFATYVQDADEDEDMMEEAGPIPDIVDVMQDMQEERSRSSRAASRLDINPSTDFMTPANRSKPTHDMFHIPTTLPTIGGFVSQPSDDAQDDGPSLCSGTDALPEPPQPAVFSPSGYQPPILHPATVSPLSRIPPSDSSACSQPSPSLTESNLSPASSSASVKDEPIASVTNESAILSAPVAPTIDTKESSPKPVDSPVPAPQPVVGTEGKKPEPAGKKKAASSAPDSAKTASSEATPMSLPASEKFRALIDVLQGLDSTGCYLPLRSMVALLFGKESRQVYARAGTASFKDYSLAAQRAGVVLMGGTGGYAWIQLARAYGGKADIPSPQTS